MLDQHADGFRMILGGGPHECGFAQGAFAGIGLCAVRQQHRHDFRVSRARRGHENGIRGMRAGLQEQVCTIGALPFSAASESGVTPYRFAAFASAPDVEQALRGLQIVGANRPVERGGAVRVGGLGLT